MFDWCYIRNQNCSDGACECVCVSGVFIYTVVIAHIFVCVCLWVDNKNMHFYLTTQHTGL